MKILVGTFNANDLKAGKDKIEVEKAKKKHNLEYTETEYVKKQGQIVGLKIFICDFDTFTL